MLLSLTFASVQRSFNPTVVFFLVVVSYSQLNNLFQFFNSLRFAVRFLLAVFDDGKMGVARNVTRELRFNWYIEFTAAMPFTVYCFCSHFCSFFLRSNVYFFFFFYSSEAFICVFFLFWFVIKLSLLLFCSGLLFAFATVCVLRFCFGGFFFCWCKHCCFSVRLVCLRSTTNGQYRLRQHTADACKGVAGTFNIWHY